MKKQILWALAGLNVLLVMTLAGRLSSDNTAMAQGVKRPSDYVMIPGEVSGGSSAVVYIIDTGSGQLGAMTYDDSGKPTVGRARTLGLPMVEAYAVTSDVEGIVTICHGRSQGPAICNAIRFAAKAVGAKVNQHIVAAARATPSTS